MNKRILASLITTLLIVSILSIPTPYIRAAKYDDLIEEISPTSGPIGVTVTVEGTAPADIDEDHPVKIYWSQTEPVATNIEYGYAYSYATPSVQEWSLLATVDEASEDTKGYEVDVTVPSVSTSGTYYIIAWQDKDGDSYIDDGEWDYAEFSVVAGIYPETGHKGDEIVVGGWTATPGGKVEVYWENQNPENKLGETYANADRSFSLTVQIPDPPAGTYSILVVDSATGSTVFIKDFELTPEITLSPDRTLPGKNVTVVGTGFAADQEITLTMYNDTVSTTLSTSPTTVETDDEGSFNCTFKVPTTINGGEVVYGTYTIKAEDEDGNSATATLTLSPIITLSTSEGPSGTLVDIIGEGFTAESSVDITMDNTECKTLDTIEVNESGIFTGRFVVPTLDVDTYTVKATDEEGKSATASFTVTGTTAIEVTPAVAAPGETVTIKGYNFTAMKDVVVTIDFGTFTEYATANTTENGEFTATVTVPDVPGTYTITATDANDLTASTTFKAVITTLTILPTSGATGTKIHIVGTGFEAGKKFNATIGGKLIIEGETDNEGAIDEYAYIPTVPVGTYTITVMDETGIKAEETFEVTATTQITLDPTSAPAGYEVTITLKYFTAAGDNTKTQVSISMYNLTADGEVDWICADLWSEDLDWEAADGCENGYVNGSGMYVGTFKVPQLDVGTYIINATDANGLTANVTFEIVKPTVIVYTGADEYLPGDRVSFFAKCIFEYKDQVINLYTPSGFKIPITGLQILTKIGKYYTGTVSYILPADAETGTWTWNTTIGGVTVSGSFNVTTRTTTGALEQRILKLKSDVSSLSDVVDKLSGIIDRQASDISKLSSSVGTLSDTVSSLKSDVSSLSDVVGRLSDMVSTQASDISKLSSSVSTLSSTVGDLATSVSSLKSDVEKLASDVKALSSAVSATQSAAEEASKAASSAQSAVSGLQMAVYGAVILSLIAAVAAIISIIIVQRKIAG